MSEYALQVRVVLAALNSQECYCLHWEQLKWRLVSKATGFPVTI
jgi:hypothetical protein